MAVLTDNRGTKLEIGQTVVFNFSGEMGIGVITKLHTSPSKRTWDNTPNELITIERKLPSGWSSNMISKVKSSKNVMVIFETDKLSDGEKESKNSSALDSLMT